MRHHVVDRIVVGLVAVWIAAIALFGWGASRPPRAPLQPAPDAPPPAPPDAAALFARHCAACHELAELRAARGGAPDRAAAALELRALLAEHFAPSPEAGAALAEHLLASD